jgi:hypothetical protein
VFDNDKENFLAATNQRENGNITWETRVTPKNIINAVPIIHGSMGVHIDILFSKPDLCL